MKSLRPTISALVLMIFLCTTGLAGQIPGFRTAGQIPATRAAGQIPAPRANSAVPINQTSRASRLDLEIAVAGLIRMLLEGGALL